ncbi:hypothetical protein SASPL_118846 [Salvia splendens]|uniref:Uncharacterized protein n=1 Tax=Salvia splendens TaxID=180675 RepID=A0A8X8XXH4_SALSN|nr:hypothetical protein SASPL_118846 [Salvia splendens]
MELIHQNDLRREFPAFPFFPQPEGRCLRQEAHVDVRAGMGRGVREFGTELAWEGEYVSSAPSWHGKGST